VDVAVAEVCPAAHLARPCRVPVARAVALAGSLPQLVPSAAVGDVPELPNVDMDQFTGAGLIGR
jgi:hypothetical protein